MFRIYARNYHSYTHTSVRYRLKAYSMGVNDSTIISLYAYMTLAGLLSVHPCRQFCFNTQSWPLRAPSEHRHTCKGGGANPATHLAVVARDRGLVEVGASAHLRARFCETPFFRDSVLTYGTGVLGSGFKVSGGGRHPVLAFQLSTRTRAVH